MTELDRLALGDMARYNPHLLSRDELVGLFSARQETLAGLLEDLKRCGPDQTPQHHLLVAQRGMGKTMLLRRVQIAIEDDPRLSEQWLPLTFPEEQYDVGGLSDLWLNSIDALGDTLERTGRETEADRLDRARDSLLHLDENQRAREAIALLLETARGLGRRLVLLVDNIDLILDRIADQAWALREVLSEERSLVLVGASAQALESTYSYGEPFYDFFQIHELQGLDLEETRGVLRCYAGRWGNEEVTRILQEEPTRIKTLQTLTGGNPRTITLLYSILARGLDGDARSDLEGLLDQCTPLYKARLEALPTQQQRIVHSLAVFWHPATASQIADELRLDVNAVSSQLTRLTKEGVVEKVAYEPGPRAGFQITERFFNIWYLMRSTRRARRRLIWFVEFLKIFYDQNQLQDHARRHLARSVRLDPEGRLRLAEYSFALAAAIEDTPLRDMLETDGLYTLLEDRSLFSNLAELLDTEDAGSPLQTRIEHQNRLEELRARVHSLDLNIPSWPPEALWQEISSWPQRLGVKIQLILQLERNELDRSASLLRDLKEEKQRFFTAVDLPDLKKAIAQAFQRGWMRSTDDIDGARFAASRLGVPGLIGFALAQRLNTRVPTPPQPDHKESTFFSELTSLLDSSGCALVKACWAHHALKMDINNPLARKFIIDLTADNISISWPSTLLDLSLGLFYIDRRSPMAGEKLRKALSTCGSRNPLLGLPDLLGTLSNAIEEFESLDLLGEMTIVITKAAETVLLAREEHPNLKELSAFHNLPATVELAGLASLGRQNQFAALIQNEPTLRTEALPFLRMTARAFAMALIPEEALRISECLIELEPANPDCRTLLGISQLLSNQWVEGKQTLQQVASLTAAPSPMVLHLLGLAHAGEGSREDAIHYFRLAAAIAPSIPLSWLELAKQLLQRPNNPTTLSSKLIAYQMQQTYNIWPSVHSQSAGISSIEEAISSLERAIALDPDNGDAWLLLATALEQDRNLKGALGAHKKATKLIPHSEVAWQGLAINLAASNLLNKAETAAREGLPLVADASLLESLLSGLQLAQEGGRESNESELAQAPTSNNLIWALNHLAWVRFVAGGREPWLEKLARRASEGEPDSTNISHTLACILAAQGKSSAAFERIEGFLESVAREERGAEAWPDVLSFFAACVEGGKAREASDLLERLELADRWAPLREALETVDYGSAAYLRRLAPEVRKPVEEILVQLGWGEKLQELQQQRTGRRTGGARKTPNRRRKRG
ncbi:MAG: hypothetical protein KDD11_18325 [Acidobacteria bacterium]|nr:hypothetical protein [Acidobacteriota bacterium]